MTMIHPIVHLKTEKHRQILNPIHQYATVLFISLKETLYNFVNEQYKSSRQIGCAREFCFKLSVFFSDRGRTGIKLKRKTHGCSYPDCSFLNPKQQIMYELKF